MEYIIATLILSPLCIVLVGIIFTQRNEATRLEGRVHLLEADLAKAKKDFEEKKEEVVVTLRDIGEENDHKIERQQEEIQQLKATISRLNAHIDSFDSGDDIVGDIPGTHAG